MIEAIGIIHKIGRFSSSGHTTKPVIWADIAAKSISTLIARRPSFDERDSRPKIPVINLWWLERASKLMSTGQEGRMNQCVKVHLPGIQHKQFVTIAALTESNSGNTININNATPIVCNDSMRKMNKKCDRCGRFHDLKKQIRSARMNAPSSGNENAITRAHIHATRSSSGNTDTNDLSRPCNFWHFHSVKSQQLNVRWWTKKNNEYVLPNPYYNMVIFDHVAIVTTWIEHSLLILHRRPAQWQT